MFHHNLLLIYRNFKRFKSTFFINLIGLSTGLACALLIYLWVNDELSVDRFNEKDGRLYQVMQSGIEATPGLLAKALAEEMPEVEYAASVVPSSWFSNKGVLAFEDVRVKAAGQFVGKDYFNLFTCKIITGDRNNVLSDKHSIAISKELAIHFFKSPENALGKTMKWTQDAISDLFHITAVFEKPPHNATNQFDVVLSYDLFFENRPGLQEWGNSDPRTFVVLKEGTDLSQFNTKVAGFLKTKDASSRSTLFLQRYSDRYLYGRYENGVPAGGRIEYIRLFSIIAVFILVIACINFMNLSTAKASRKIKEVGIRKAIGAGRKALIAQYLGESMVMTFLSLLIALILVQILLPSFNGITGKHLALIFDTTVVTSLLAITFFTGFISGSYPALYLSGFKPAEVLKGKLVTAVGELWARKGLVVFQFAVSVILIVSVMVVYKQITYVQSKNLGYSRDNILHFEIEIKNDNDPAFFELGGKQERNVETFLNKVKDMPGVIGAANFYHNLTGGHGELGGVDWEAGTEDEKKGFSNLEVGYDFIETLGIEMAAGRSYSRDFNSTSETSKIIFNEEAIRMMGLKDPIGKTIRLWGRERQIIGVAKNFHFESLYEDLKPCLIQLEPRVNNILVKIRAGAETETIGRLQQLYRAENSGLAFDYRFLDDDYQALYASEKRVSILSQYFAVLAIVISCLGLFGLAAFTAERRQKEIGIRKVLGSSVMGIVYLLSGDFTKIVLTAIVIALPISYFIARQWLDAFAFKITLEAWYFAGAGLAALLIAWLTVGTQALKAANINPSKCLKEE